MESGYSGKILVIDDEPSVREGMVVYLEDSDFEVYQAQDGGEGLELIKALQPDVVLCDLRMPGVDGMDVTWLAELSAGYRFRFQRWGGWDLNILAGYKAVGVDVKSSTKDIETDLIYHGPVLKLGVEF